MSTDLNTKNIISTTMLRSFVLIVENDCNYTVASKNGNTSQSGLSAIMMRLEDALGYKLLERKNKRDTHITTKGKKAYKLALKSLKPIDDLIKIGE